MLELVRWQVGLGPRVPGSAGHETLRQAIGRRLEQWADSVAEQRFAIRLGGKRVSCSNLVGRFHARAGGASLPAASRPLLLGTHYDTRPIADREPDPHRRLQPIPGANDGGSGTAVLLHLLPFFAGLALARDLALAFFDAEDVGGIDGNSFSMGARHLAASLPTGVEPAEVVVLDMVGGKNLVLDTDAHGEIHPPSAELAARVFEVGIRSGLAPFVRASSKAPRAIVCDHLPFLLRGIPACLLIDLDYPQWHTQADLPEALSADSLEAMAEAVRQLPPRLGG